MRYVLFNKPFNVLCQFTSEGIERETLANYVSIPNVYPAGRLDYDSEGLVLLTDDGALQHRMTDPKFGHTRSYLVQVEGEITEAALKSLRQGVRVQNYISRPAEARPVDNPKVWPRKPAVRIRKHIPTSWLELTLTEGRNRQVRRMTAAVGFPTLRLIRTAIGPITITDLMPGSWRDLSSKEVRDLRSVRAMLS